MSRRRISAKLIIWKFNLIYFNLHRGVFLLAGAREIRIYATSRKKRLNMKKFLNSLISLFFLPSSLDEKLKDSLQFNYSNRKLLLVGLSARAFVCLSLRSFCLLAVAFIHVLEIIKLGILWKTKTESKQKGSEQSNLWMASRSGCSDIDSDMKLPA